MRSHVREQTSFTEASTSFCVTALLTHATILMWARFRHSDRINLEGRQVGPFKETACSSSETTKRSANPRVFRFLTPCPRLRRAVEPFVPPRTLRRPAPRPNYLAVWTLRSKNTFPSGLCLTAALSPGQTGT